METIVDEMGKNGRFKDHVNDYELLPLFIQDVINNRKFSVHNEPPNLEWFLTKKNTNGGTVGVASRGELVMLYGPEKSRKSTLASCITASGYVDERLVTLGFNLELTQTDNVLWIDTEMPRTAFHRRQEKLNHMCGFHGLEDIPNYQAYSVKPYSHRERLAQIEYFVKSTPNLALIVIDQMADLVADINDRESTAELINKLSYWSDLSQALILGTIHVSRNTRDMTGVTGHELAKKMDSGFYNQKDDETGVTIVKHLLSREEDVDDFEFKHNPNGYPVLVVDEIEKKDEHKDF